MKKSSNNDTNCIKNYNNIYRTPVVDIVVFETEDIIRTSNQSGNGLLDNPVFNPSGVIDIGGGY